MRYIVVCITHWYALHSGMYYTLVCVTHWYVLHIGMCYILVCANHDLRLLRLLKIIIIIIKLALTYRPSFCRCYFILLKMYMYTMRLVLFFFSSSTL